MTSFEKKRIKKHHWLTYERSPPCSILFLTSGVLTDILYKVQKNFIRKIITKSIEIKKTSIYF